MPLYIKLDFGSSGDIHAWVSRNDRWDEQVSEVNAPSAARCLRLLAQKLGKLENKKKVEPKKDPA